MSTTASAYPTPSLSINDFCATLIYPKGVILNASKEVNPTLYQDIVDLVKAGNWEKLYEKYGSGNISTFTVSETVEVISNTVYINDSPLNPAISKDFVESPQTDLELACITNFQSRLDANPAKVSVEGLWRFLETGKYSITDKGYFIAYKAVRSDYLDIHSGTFINTPGSEHEMDRSLVSTDPNHACAPGFHVGSYSYAKGFKPSSGRIMKCLVDPANVCRVPFDHASTKIGLCKYKVLEEITEIPEVERFVKHPIETINLQEILDTEKSYSVSCPNCNSTKLRNKGKTTLKDGTVSQRYKCKSCDHPFTVKL